MKMKKACEATGLTERAIRLYLSKNLIAPRQMNGTIDFSEEDIQHLKDVAIMRQFGFTIEQISGMIHNPDGIPGIVRYRMDDAQANAAREAEAGSLLSRLDENALDSLRSVAEGIRRCRASVPEPNFRQFEEVSDELYQDESAAAYRDIVRQERRENAGRRALKLACIVLMIAVLAVMFFSCPRVRGFIAVGPLTVLDVSEEGTATVSVDDARTAEIIGRNTISVPYRIFGVNLKAGDVFENGCQLAVELTNLDLARIGVNPFQTLRTGNAEINYAWIKHILQVLFDSGLDGRATLWIREISGMKLLIDTEFME